MRLLSLSFAGAAAVLTACASPPQPVGLEPVNVMGGPETTLSAPAETVPAASPVSDGSCNAALYSDLVGEPISVVSTLRTGLRVRVLAADAFVTRDFDPNRLTFTTTRDDTVGRVFCG